LFALCVCVAYLLSAVQQIFGAHAAALPLMLGATLVGCAVALWAPLRDTLAGGLLRAGNVLCLGDEVRIGDVRGKVERFGYRRLFLRTAEGEAIVPYAMVSQATIVRAGSARGRETHTFRVRPIAGVARLELRRAIHESALLCHWSSPARDPVLATAEQGAIDVTVFAIAGDYAPEIESAVRRRLSALEQARAGEALGRVAQMPGLRDSNDGAGGAGGA
jgi:hypothetical protein